MIKRLQSERDSPLKEPMERKLSFLQVPVAALLGRSRSSTGESEPPQSAL